MAYHDELMAHALDLIHVSPSNEMFLRRAVSAAYYAVFHLLIFESTQHWDNPALRTTLGRGYDHGLMRTTSNRVLDSREFPYESEDSNVVATLKNIAQGFSQLQQDRHFADYNLTQPLDPKTALSQSNERNKFSSHFLQSRTNGSCTNISPSCLLRIEPFSSLQR